MRVVVGSLLGIYRYQYLRLQFIVGRMAPIEHTPIPNPRVYVCDHQTQNNFIATTPSTHIQPPFDTNHSKRLPRPTNKARTPAPPETMTRITLGQMHPSVVSYCSARCRSRSIPRPSLQMNAPSSYGCIRPCGCSRDHQPSSNIPTRIPLRKFME